MRKPKIHPKYGTSLVGINFRERWNIVEHATKAELEMYISNFKHIKTTKLQNESRSWWDMRQKIVNESVHNVYLRKVWRKRHSETFEHEKLYRMDRNVARWNTKLGPTCGEGLAASYQYERNKNHLLRKDDLLVLVKVDEMGNLYFSKVKEITAPHLYAFNRDNANLGYIIPVET